MSVYSPVVLVTILIVALIRHLLSLGFIRSLENPAIQLVVYSNKRQQEKNLGLGWDSPGLCCIAVGGVGGHFIGLQMAQSVANPAVENIGPSCSCNYGNRNRRSSSWSGISRNSGKRRPGGWKLRSEVLSKAEMVKEYLGHSSQRHTIGFIPPTPSTHLHSQSF